VLKDGFAEAETHHVMFDGSGLASGIYFARLEAGAFSQTKKLMLLKQVSLFHLYHHHSEDYDGGKICNLRTRTHQ
jgi:hypothetical protein